MGAYGNASQQKLNTCHPDLITLFQEVVKGFDNTIIYGERTPTEQFELYKQGRKQDANGKWIVVDKSKVVTYKDGTINKSEHNYSPSHAVDAAPYYTTEPHIRWKDTRRMDHFAGFVRGVAFRLKAEGKITHNIRWGGDWDNDTEVKDETFMDLVHFEIID